MTYQLSVYAAWRRVNPRLSTSGHVPEKRAFDLIEGGDRFSEQDMLKTPLNLRAAAG
jgi:hypothetical protein